MKVSRERIMAEAKATGFRPEVQPLILKENAIRLLELR